MNKITTSITAVAIIPMVAFAAVPLRWTVETSRVQPASFDAYHGETLALEATLQSYGKPHSTGFNDYQIYWQTNGMEDVYWSAPATCLDNVVTASFTPEMDTGANLVRGFFGCPGEDFRAAFKLRLRPSPGATPNTIELPAHVIDFAKVTVENAPWADTAYVEELFDRTQHPVPYVISETAVYHYNGSGGIPAGDYYKATTGDGYVRYAAQVPMPKGKIVMTGDDDDPVLQYFGSVFRISSIATRITSLSSMVDVGKYQVADVTFAPDTMLGVQATFHVNLLNPVPELTGISMQPADGYISFTDERGIHHSIYSMYASGPYSYTYSDEAYDPYNGMWTSIERTITVGFERDGDTAFGFAVFGGSPIATVDQIDVARSKMIERTGKPGELGSGWGRKIYDFTSDERLWELQTPRLNASLSYLSTTKRTYYQQNTWAAFGIPRPSDAANTYAYALYEANGADIIDLPNLMAVKEVTSTSNKYSSAGCQYVDYRIGVIAIDPDRSDSVANGRFALTLDAKHIGINAAGQSYLWGSLETADMIEGLSLSRTSEMTYAFGSTSAPIYTPPSEVTATYYDFNFGSQTSSYYTKTIKITYKVMYTGRAAYLTTGGLYALTPETVTIGPFSRTVTLNLTTANSLETTRVHANKVITDYNQGMYWDPGLKCTWQIGVTNGMFYTRKISNRDYRKEEYVDETL